MTRLPPQTPTQLSPVGAAIPEPEAPAGGVNDRIWRGGAGVP